MGTFESTLGYDKTCKPITDRFYVADDLLRTDHAKTLRQYDLSGFPGIGEVDEDVAMYLDGLNFQSLDISDNPEQGAQLEYFYQRFARPDVLVHAQDGIARRYAGVCFSALGEEGSLLHIRHIEPGSDDGLSPESPLNNLVVIGHIDDPDLAAFHYAINRLDRNIDGTTESVYDIVPMDEPVALTAVDGVSKADIVIDRLRSVQRTIDRRPVVALRNTTKLYKRSDLHWEGIRNLEKMRERIRLGVLRKYGESTLKASDDSFRQMFERKAS